MTHLKRREVVMIAETEHDNHPVHFKGKHCVRDFLEWLDTLTEKDMRPVTVIAHNFQGYDGYFIVNEYHKQHLIVVSSKEAHMQDFPKVTHETYQ